MEENEIKAVATLLTRTILEGQHNLAKLICQHIKEYIEEGVEVKVTSTDDLNKFHIELSRPIKEFNIVVK